MVFSIKMHTHTHINCPTTKWLMWTIRQTIHSYRTNKRTRTTTATIRTMAPSEALKFRTHQSMWTSSEQSRRSEGEINTLKCARFRLIMEMKKKNCNKMYERKVWYQFDRYKNELDLSYRWFRSTIHFEYEMKLSW